MTADYRRRSDALNDLYRRFADEDHEQTRADYKALLQLPAFRRVLMNVVKRSRVFGSISFDKADVNEVMKAIGFRELGVDVYMAANQADGAMVLKAIEERNAVERERRERLEKATKGNER